MKDLQSGVKETRHSCALLCVVFLIILGGGVITTAQQTPAKHSQLSAQPEAERPTTRGDDSITVNTDLVTVTVSVADSQGRYLPGLNKSDFTITDNKVPQEITFFSDDDLPVSVGIVFDVSGSMSGDKIEKAKEALSAFIRTSHPNDEYFLFDFSSQARLLIDRSHDGDAVIKKLTFVEPHGSTALFDASYVALDRVARGTRPKHAILIISDGQDNSSRYTLSELRRSLRESDATVYAIAINGGFGGALAMYGNLVLEELASVSGGKAFFPKNSSQMNEAFEQIALELRHQYSIGYRPSSFTMDGKWHRVRVKVIPPSDSKRIFVRP